MYAAIRPALRSVSKVRSPAKLIQNRRYPLSIRPRSFHSSISLAKASDPPPTPEKQPLDNNDADKKSRGTEGAGQTDAEATTEDPELLAQKLQRSREMTRRYSSALKRSQRRNRAQDMPPVPIPTWFLEHKVTLREEVDSAKKLDTGARVYSVSLRNKLSGEQATCSLPLLKSGRDSANLHALVRETFGAHLSEKQREQFLRALVQINSDADFEQLLKRDDILKAVHSPPEGLPKTEAVSSPEIVPSVVLSELQATIAACLTSTHAQLDDYNSTSKTNLILHTPSDEHEEFLKSLVLSIAAGLEADVVSLDAQDLAQLAGDYLGEGSSPQSIRALGYDTYQLNSDLAGDVAEWEMDEANEDEQPEAAPRPEISSVPPRLPPGMFQHLKEVMQRLKREYSSDAEGFTREASNTSPSGRSQSPSEVQLQDLKLSTLLQALLDAPETKRTHIPVSVGKSQPSTTKEERDGPKFFDPSTTTDGAELDFTSSLPTELEKRNSLFVRLRSTLPTPRNLHNARIIYVSDFKQLQATNYGSRLIQKLEEVVQRRRSEGDQIMIIGGTDSLDLIPELSASAVHNLQSDAESGSYRTIVVPVVKGELEGVQSHAVREIASKKPGEMALKRAKEMALGKGLSSSQQNRYRRINLRHIQQMLHSLDQVTCSSIASYDAIGGQAAHFGPIFPESYSWKTLSYDEVHRVALTALGLFRLDNSTSGFSWVHVALAAGLLRASDNMKFIFIRDKHARQTRPDQPQVDMVGISMTASKHEKRLMHGIINPDQIKTTFDHVHVPKETIEAIRTLTSLSLLRPDAFDYGVLATDKISGVLLYGPPGTGKTLLAKAVAKESGSSVLEVSGSEINDKYVGEGEKNVRAIFTLAQKLSPCIVFLDEADAIFASRDEARQRVSHRDILNQFLKEWDGLNNASVFVMVASNRPFDLDDAVIRRLPRRLLVDLPTPEDRKKILEIHLRGEQLHKSVDLEELSKRTPLYSGSDLKNVAVSAALACVREENEQAAIAAAKAAAEEENLKSESQDSSAESPESEPATKRSESEPQSQDPPTLVFGRKYDFPEKRVLHSRHFDKALQEISASISEDMSSLNAIKKFDEQYGDRKGRRKKNAYGFGIHEDKTERSARVRK
ncbi:hypothetical protein BCR34DRAFT_624388 [Clohesyomyces aquaticus]|uniref:AAA+ ATPase domain-containing protein n=1 Tax=Clohesyomyces aquaticus TaxID=1231657 RepID=A0A1Y1ZQ78_9PLEO|nr:hypothetical protein BCR34DRAFT_624388 [Clohesyomyces aquaticus]